MWSWAKRAQPGFVRGAPPQADETSPAGARPHPVILDRSGEGGLLWGGLTEVPLGRVVP